MSDEDTRWRSVRGSITTIPADGHFPEYREFRLSAHSASGGVRSQVVRVESERLKLFPDDYKRTLHWMVRDLEVWGPR